MLRTVGESWTDSSHRIPNVHWSIRIVPVIQTAALLSTLNDSGRKLIDQGGKPGDRARP
jgi:hypothetical protein